MAQVRSGPDELDESTHGVVPSKQEAPTYGERETMALPLGQLIRVSQVREGENPLLADIKESIAKSGLYYPIDVAVLDRESLSTYLDFIGWLWKSTSSIDEFSPDEEGNYYLVIAGHTRVEAIEQIENERAQRLAEEGIFYRPGLAKIKSNLYYNPKPEDIVAHQLAENLHSQPAPERQAMAIVESYFYGLRYRLWRNKAEFLRVTNRKFSKGALDSALSFVELPADIRSFVFAGGLPYRAGVALGRSLPYVEGWFLKKYHSTLDRNSLTAEAQIELQQNIIEWLGHRISDIQAESLNGPAAIRMIESYVDNYRQFAASEETAQGSLGIMIDPVHEMRLYRRRQRYAYKTRLQAISEQPLSKVATIINLHLALFGHEREAELEAELAERLKRFSAKIGTIAVIAKA